MANIFFPTTDNLISGVFVATFGCAPGATYLAQARTLGAAATAQVLINASGAQTPADLAARVMGKLGVTTAMDTNSALLNYLTGVFTTAGVANSGQALVDVVTAFPSLGNHPVYSATYGTAADAFAGQTNAATAYSTVATNSSTDLAVLTAAVGTPGVVSGQTFTLTTSIDNLTGTSGNDIFNGSIVGNNGTGSTINPGDIITGGTGTDTVAIAASSTAAAVVAAVNFAGIEKVLVSDFNTGGNSDVSLALADSSLTTVGLSSSDAAGTLTFSGLTKVVDAEMKSGANGLTLAFTAGTDGLTDAINLAVAGAGTKTATANFTAAGIETINVNSSLVKSYVGVIGANAATVNIAGGTEVSVDVSSATNTNLKTVDASTATGKVTVATGATAPSSYTAIKGGTGTTDVFATAYNGANITGTVLATVSGFEVLKATGAGATVSLTAPLTGISSFDTTDAGIQTVTLNVGYTGATSVEVGETGVDTVNNTANVALTVSGTGAAFGTAVVNGSTTGVDTLSITADDAATTFAAQTARNLTNDINLDNITIVADTTTPTLGAKLSNVKSTSTTVTVNVNASGLTSSSALFGITANAANTGKMSILGGAGNDTIDLNASTVANTVDGGSGKDTITAGAGNDSLQGGAGDDKIIMGANLTSADTIDGGAGTDTLTVSSLTSAAGFANVTNVETIGITGATAASLTSAIGTAVTFDLTDVAVQTLTLGTGYTGTTTVKMGATGVDAITNSANVALTATGASLNFNTATITGGTGADAITMTADDNAATSGTQTSRSLANVSGVETITVSASTTTPSLGVKLTTGASTWTKTTAAMSVDASALGSTAIFNFDGAATVGQLSVTGGAGNDVIIGGDAAETLIGGAGNDFITGSDTTTINDSISAGDGNDTITMNSGAGQLDFSDTIDGGAGTDTLIVGAAVSGMLAHVTNVETLQLGNAGAASFGVDGVGFNSFDLTAAVNAQSLTLAAGFTGATTVTVNAATTSTTDIITNSANVALNVKGAVAAFASGKNQIVGGTGVDTLTITADNTAATLDAANAKIDAITLVASTTATDDASITLGAGQAVATGGTMTVDATALTNSGAVFTFDASGNTGTGKFSITGGAGNDIITGDANADTINGGSGDDSIVSGAGLDVLTGGAGNDQFVVSANANGLTFASITDATAGDVVSFGTQITGQPSLTVPTQMTLAAGATTLSDYVNAATAGDGSTTSILNWFQFGGNTYMVADNNAASTFTATVAGTADLIVQLAGAIDLSSSAIAASASGADWVLGTTTTSAPGTRPAAALTIATGATDTLQGGAGDDVFSAAGGAGFFANGDTIAGGLGSDQITLAASDTIIDNVWTKVTSVEKLLTGTSCTVTVGPLAQAAGLTTITSGGTALTVTSTMTSGLIINTATNNGTLAYTAGTGADKIEGGTGVETMTFGANLTSADTIAGGAGTDIIKVSGAVADAAFTNITAVETLDFTATGSVVLGTLSNAAGIVTVTNSGAAAITVDGSGHAAALNITGGAAADVITGGAAADTIATGGGADIVIGGGAADSITGGGGVDIVKWTATTAALFATETGSTAGTNVTAGAGVGDAISTWVSATDKLHFAAAAVTNAIGTEADTLLSILKGGTVTNAARFVHITNTAVGDGVNAGAGAVTVLNGLTTSAVAIGDSFIVAMDDDTNTYLYYVKQVSAADTIAAQDVTLIGVINGITTVANGDFVSF